jgi:hypothetical protein
MVIRQPSRWMKLWWRLQTLSFTKPAGSQPLFHRDP